jgi:hypothetical protein
MNSNIDVMMIVVVQWDDRWQQKQRKKQFHFSDVWKKKTKSLKCNWYGYTNLWFYVITNRVVEKETSRFFE